MRMHFAWAIIFVLVFSALRQGKEGPKKSPTEVVQDFVKSELEGARLSAEGQRGTARFLVHPSIAAPYPINIVSVHFRVNEVPTAPDRPRLNVYFPYFYGQLDSALGFTPSEHARPGNSILREGTNQEYTLVLTDVQQDSETRDSGGEESRRAKEWRIENVPHYGFVGLAAAIRYVAEMREKTADPVIKKNADETLAKLKKLRQSSK